MFIKFVYNISLCLKITRIVYELQGHSNFFAQCAMVPSQRETAMKEIIGHCRLSSVCRSFMNSGGELNHGDEVKSKLVDVLRKHVSQSKILASECLGADIVAIDAMQVIQKMSNPSSVKIFKGLGDKSGCARAQEIMQRGRHCVAQSGYLGNTISVEFSVDDAFDISNASLKEILSHTRTKQQLTSFFAKKLQTYLEQKDIDFVIAGNGSTIMPWGKNLATTTRKLIRLLLT